MDVRTEWTDDAKTISLPTSSEDNKNGGEWRFNPSVLPTKGDRIVRARALPVCDNGTCKCQFCVYVRAQVY